jgi:hypothetical protein
VFWFVLFICIGIHNLYIFANSGNFSNEEYYKVLSITTTNINIINTILFLIFRNVNLLIAYYVYDLIIIILCYKKDRLLIIHHIISLYALTINPSGPDYDNIMSTAYLQKLGDLFLHIQKIYGLRKVNIENVTTRITFLKIALCTWILTRILLSFRCYPFHAYDIWLIALLIHCANVIWAFKICGIYFNTCRLLDNLELKEELNEMYNKLGSVLI